MNDAELTDLVASLRAIGSDVSDIEAKRAATDLPRSIRETLSSFSNTSGGVVVLGLSESEGFRATGVRDAGAMADALANMAAAEMEPPLRPYIGIHDFEGVQIITAEIPELPISEKPCFYKGAGITQGSYIRVFDGDRHLTPYEVQLMLSSRGQPNDDVSPVTPFVSGVLDENMVQSFCDRMRRTRTSFRSLDNMTVLRRSCVLIEHENETYVSLAGLLALGTFPQQLFPHLNVTFVHYPTPTGEPLASGERFLDNASIDGPIPIILDEALAVIRKNMTRRAVISGAGRTDVWEYPEEALREAIANALLHRDLSPGARGTQVQIEMYPDRLLVRNPGGLFGPVRLERLGEEGVSSSRNSILMRILDDVPVPDRDAMMCEKRGSGIRTMVSSLRHAGMTLPRFEDRVSTFTVTFLNHALMSERAVSWIAALHEDNLTPSQITCLATLFEGEIVDNNRYRKLAEVDSRVATNELQNLVARELIEPIGKHRWTRYKLTQRAARIDPDKPDSHAHARRADRRDAIIATLADREMSRADIADESGLSDKVVAYWLGILQKEGTVEKVVDPNDKKAVTYRVVRADGMPRLFE